MVVVVWQGAEKASKMQLMRCVDTYASLVLQNASDPGWWASGM